MGTEHLNFKYAQVALPANQQKNTRLEKHFRPSGPSKYGEVVPWQSNRAHLLLKHRQNILEGRLHVRARHRNKFRKITIICGFL